MRAVVGFLALGLLVLGALVGALAARWAVRKGRDLRTLARYQRLVANLQDTAEEHAELGDPFAVIALDEIRNSNLNPPKGTR